MPQISIIVPVYKVEPYLHRCVDSILAQTFTDFELILVDDGSPDNCGTICDEYAAVDRRILVIHQKNQGQAAARNHALDWVFEHSDSEYISFVDSDDWVHPRYLELLREGIKRYNANICQCAHLETDGTDEAPAVVDRFSYVTAEEQYVKHYSAFMWDKLFTRSCWENMRFPEGQIYEDVAIWYKMLFVQNCIALIHAALYFYYHNPQSTVLSAWTPRCIARMDAWDAQISFFKKMKNRGLMQTVVKYYCRIASQEYIAIQKSNMLTETERKKYSFQISRRLRKVLCRFFSSVRTNKSFVWYLEIAFPFCSSVYWTAEGIKKKIKRVFRTQLRE